MGEACFACGAIVPRMEGPTHRYLDGSPGCWGVFGEVLAAEFGDQGFYRVHGLTVDAYARGRSGALSPRRTLGHLRVGRLGRPPRHGARLDREAV